MNFQVTILKVLVSYPDGFASLADIKRDIAILATSGREWSERTTRFAARSPGLEIFAQALVERREGGWRITDAGRSALDLMEKTPVALEEPSQAQIAPPEQLPAIVPPESFVVAGANRRLQRRRRGRGPERTSADRERLLGGNPACATSASQESAYSNLSFVLIAALTPSPDQILP